MAEHEDHEAFFRIEGDEVIPAPSARGPWSADMLHGRLLGGLLARAIEREHAAEGLHVARLTVDLYRNSPLVPLRVTTERARDGRRIRVADAAITGPNGAVARASAVMLRRGEQPEGQTWNRPPWDVASPGELGESMTTGTALDVWWMGPGTELSTAERHRAWVRETRPLVAGESLSPFVRVALAADMASPIAHFGSAGLKFINADYTLGLSRLPLGDVIGLEATGHLSEDGVAVGQCALYDLSGPIGFCTTSAVANT